MTSLHRQISSHIRSIDRDNRLPAGQVGEKVADFLASITGGGSDLRARMGGFVKTLNPNKTLPPGRIAAAIITEFKLPEDGAEWRDGYDRSEPTWIRDDERGQPGVMFTWAETTEASPL